MSLSKYFFSLLLLLFTSFTFVGCSTASAPSNAAVTAPAHSATFQFFMTHSKTIFKVGLTPVAYRDHHRRWPSASELVIANKVFFRKNIQAIQTATDKAGNFHLRFKMKVPANSAKIENPWIEAIIMQSAKDKKSYKDYDVQIKPHMNDIQLVVTPSKFTKNKHLRVVL